MRAGLFFALTFLTAVTAIAQSDRGTITGTVLDPAGAIIPDAAVEARNTATGSVYPAAHQRQAITPSLNCQWKPLANQPLR